MNAVFSDQGRNQATNDIVAEFVRNAQAFDAMDTGKADAWAGDDVVLTAAATEELPAFFVVSRPGE